jgi:choice-of-anchor B domain-containing protein
MSQTAYGVLAATLSISLLPAQTNCRLLAHVDKHPGAIAPRNNYAGMWGIVGNDGKEYAIVPARPGTIIYDASDPRNPREVIEIPGPSGGGTYFWREANSLGGEWIYTSSEHGPLQAINMTNPAVPSLAGTFGPTAHTVSVDVAARRLWASGYNGFGGSEVYDVGANRSNPPRIGGFASPYVHDCLPVNGFGYFAMIFNGLFQIRDIRNPAATILVSSTTTPGAFTHNVWINDDETLAVTADENMGGCLTVYDITNKAAPVQRSTWCSPNGATVHNVFIRGSVAFFSSYTDGFWAIDLSDPATPRPICRFDTNALGGSGYEGCWGCYPFQPSGVIYLSDMQNGLWIVEPTCGVPLLYGQGNAGRGGFVPTIDYAGGFAKVGNSTFKVAGKKMRGGTTAVLLFGFGQANLPVFGFNLLVDVGGPHIVLVSPTGGTVGGGGTGSATFNLGIPGDPSVAGTTTYSQFVVVDADAPGGIFAASRGMRLTVCP